LLSLEAEVNDLKDKISHHQKKHRRCDRDIEKHEQVSLVLSSALSAKRNTAQKLHSNYISNSNIPTIETTMNIPAAANHHPLEIKIKRIIDSTDFNWL
jgi:chromosome segregation ATPase